MKISKVKNIKKTDYRGKVYDLCFDNEHYFYASKNEENNFKNYLLIHNSQPDIDVDFESGSDEKTTEFLLTKYGK